MKRTTQAVCRCAVLTALAMALSWLEGGLPLSWAVPLPGVKLGLANLVTLFALYALGPGESACILFCRCFLGGLFAGNLSALAFSLMGGAAALGAMWLVVRTEKCSLYGVSIAGAAAHQCGQVAAAILQLGNWGPLYYLPILLGVSLGTGSLTAFAASLLFQRFQRLPVGRRED